MVSTPANSLDITSAGIVKFDGTATFSADTVTQHDVLVGGASNAITSVAPSATSGVPLISQGSSSDPAFGTAVVAGGGTGATTLTGVLIGNGTSAVTGNAVTQYDVLVGGASNAISSVGPGTALQVLQSGGIAANPAYSTATYPATTTVSQLLYSSSANVVAGLATANNATLTTSATGVPQLTSLGSNGDLLIGSGSGPPLAATLTAGTGITITNAANSITVAVNGSGVGETITGNSGGALSPTSGNWNVLGTASTTTSGSGSTLTVELTGLTQYNVQTGGATGATLNNVAPSATSGVPFISQGSSSQPVFGTAVVAGGGTGATTLTGVLTGNGTSAVTANAVTQYGTVIAGASNAVSSVAPSATSGIPYISQGSSSNPTFGTAVVAGGGTGATTLTGVLTGNGTSAVTASAVTQYAVLVGGASNAVGSVADVATGQVLVSGGVSANPAFSAYPQVSGLGIGASPGSTAGLTFDGSNFMNNYVTDTSWTPTVSGATTAGSTTYTIQQGYYTRIGNLVTVQGIVQYTAATGTGNLLIGGLPFTVKNQTNYYPVGSVLLSSTAGTFPAGTTYLTLNDLSNSTTCGIYASGSAVGGGQYQLQSVTTTLEFSITYQI